MFEDIIEGEIRRCCKCWWSTGHPAKDAINKIHCSLQKKDKDKDAYCQYWRPKFNK